MARIEVMIEMLYAILDAIDRHDTGTACAAVSSFRMYIREVCGYEVVREAVPIIEEVEDAICSSEYTDAIRSVADLLDELEKSREIFERPQLH